MINFKKYNKNSNNLKREKTLTFPFFMISTCFPQIINKMLRENPAAILIFFALIDCSNNNGAVIISEEALHKYLHVGITTVYRAVKYLNNNGYIKIIEYKKRNLYIINSNIFWHTKSFIREKLAKDMDFTSAAKLTQTKNRKYYNDHHNLKAHNDTPNHNDVIKEYIKKYHASLKNKKEISKTHAKDRRHAKNNIKKQIQRHKWTSKELDIIHYLLQHIPLDANSLGFKITNKKLCRPTKSSYATVAKATLKLKRLDIIIHKHGYIKYNPQLLPMTKANISIHKSNDKSNHRNKKP